MDRTAIATDGRRPIIRILTTRGVLRARPCPLCAALVLDAGGDRHDDQHRADAQRADDLAEHAVRLVDALVDALGRRPAT